eukprot:TRINITY_DN11352_c0_g1_i1.p1 TRINITY_DN11352_c0_g1~~TRINITY_DN11352_c0_g1_i1.p1  ORF type:complete len:584 (+),score=36.85 TRINITY_DN11352_c0_g1_i1:68-1819(+)
MPGLCTRVCGPLLFLFASCWGILRPQHIPLDLVAKPADTSNVSGRTELSELMDACSKSHARTIGSASDSCPIECNNGRAGLTMRCIGTSDCLMDSCWEQHCAPPPPILQTEMYENSILNRPSLPSIDSILRERKCLKIVALGGSVTYGHFLCRRGCDCFKSPYPAPSSIGNSIAWPERLKEWLDARHPCGSQGHEVNNLGFPAKGSDFFANKIMEWKADAEHPLLKADLVIIEAAVNDLPEFQASMSKGRETGDSVKSFTELIARQLLQLKNKPALLWAELAFKDLMDKSNSFPPTGLVIDAHRAVTAHYGLSHVSAYHALQATLPSMREWLMTYYLWDDVHLSLTGQRLAAQIIGHFLTVEDELKVAAPSLGSIPLLPARWIPASVDEAYLSGKVERHEFTDFSKIAPNIVVNAVNGNTGTLSTAFTVDSNVLKPGLKAKAAGSELLLGFYMPSLAEGSRKLFLSLGLLKSQSSMGVVEVSFRTSSSTSESCHLQATFNATLDAAFSKVVGNGDDLDFRKKTVDCLWEAKYTTYATERFRVIVPHGHSCLWMHAQVLSSGRMKNEIELFDLSVITASFNSSK